VRRVSTPKLTTIGLDAATFAVIDPMLEAGELPNLERLFAAGARGVLRSVTHPLTPHAWSTMTTGVNAGRHGIWDFPYRTEGSYGLRAVNGSDRCAPAVWDRLSAAGVRSALVSIPFSGPAPEIEGCVLAGFDSAERGLGFTHPVSLADELRSRFGDLALDNRYPIGQNGEFDVDLVQRAAEQKVEIALWLADRYEVDFLFAVFMAADHVHHLCWDDWERRGLESRVADVYRILDRAAGALADAAGADGDVLVVSDHGGGKLEGVVNLNYFLAERGYLAYGGAGTLGRRAASRVFQLRRFFPEAARTWVKRRLPTLSERAEEATSHAIVDWGRTRAFAYGTFGNVVINVRGREAEGIVAPEEYEAVRAEVAEALRELRGRDGEPIVGAVHRREDLCYGPEISKVPDLVVEFEEYKWLGKGSLSRRGESLWDRIEIESSNHSYVGSHRIEGIVSLTGPSAAAGRTIEADIQDIAPTMLYLLGQPLPSDLDGRLITEALDPAMLDGRLPEYADEESNVLVSAVERYSPEDTAAVEERLRSLGYLE
jgi:predicted AlkP superfamily phosphohydrolase/phosphomutase